MKKVILFAAFAVAGFASFAQNEDASKLKFSAGVEAALPIGDFGKVSSFGIGGSAQADYSVAENFSLGLNVGYLSFSGKDQTVSTPLGNVTIKGVTTGQIPVLLGGKYSFNENLYGQAQLGLSFASGNGAKGSSFTYAPGVGYKFSENIDALVKFWGWSKSGSNSNAIGLRVAYTF